MFELPKTEKIAVSTRKKAERKNITFRFGRCNQHRLSCGFIFYKFYPLGIYKCTNNEFEFLKLQNILQIEKTKQTSRSIAKIISRRGVKKNHLIGKIKLPHPHFPIRIRHPQVSSPRFADTSFASRFFELFTLPASLKLNNQKEKCTKYVCI